MNHKIKKVNLFKFLKSEQVIEEVTGNSIDIFEHDSGATLKKATITDLKDDSTYWFLDPETKTFLQPFSKKVDGIILEQDSEGNLNIILVELKSTTVRVSDVLDKFEKSLSWVYLLLNLLNGKENQVIKVFGILIAQKNKNWDKKDNLEIFNSTSVRYIKRSFYTTLSEDTYTHSNIIASI